MEVIRSLALIYESEEKYELAIKYHNDCKNIVTWKYDELSLEVLQCDKFIAECLLKINKQDGVNMYEDILKKEKLIYENFKKKQKKLDSIQEIIEEDILKLGIIFADDEIRRYRESIKYIKKILQPMSKRYGDNSNEVISSIRTLARAYFEVSEYDNAYRYANKALKKNLENNTCNSEVLALDYNNLAYVLYMLGNKSKAIELIKESVNIIENNKGIHLNTKKIIKENFELIMYTSKDNIIDIVKKYEFKHSVKNNCLVIKPVLKK